MGRLIVILLAALLVAGCGGDDEAPRATATPTPTPTDAQVAEASLLTLADFPQGWTEAPNPRPGQSSCQRGQEALSAASGRADSPIFLDGTLPVVSGSAFVYADEPAAVEAFEALGDTDTHTCFGEEFASSIAGQLGIEVGEIDASPLELEDAAASRLTVPVTAGGLELEAIFDVVFARTGRGIAFWVFGNSGAPFDEALRDELLAKAVSRLASNLG